MVTEKSSGDPRGNEMLRRMALTPTRALTRQLPARLGWLVELLRFGFILAVFLYFILPGNLLVLMGWDYLGLSGGPAFEKIHLATYLLVSVFGLLLIFDTRFRNIAPAICFTNFPFAAFSISAAATALFAVIVRQVSIAPFIDTLGTAIIATLGMICLPVAYMSKFRRLLDAYFVVSIAIIFFEYFTKTAIVNPGAYNHYQESFRASALFEGPLSAASLLGLYSLVVLISTRIDFSLYCIGRLLLSLMAFVAVLTTGGRTAFVATAVVISGFLGFSVFRQIRLGYLNKAAAVYFVIAIPLVIGALIVAISLGLFDTIIERFQNDIGSALSRKLAVDLVLNMSTGELFFGLSATDVLNLVSVQAEYNLIAIEVSWINFILVCGLFSRFHFLSLMFFSCFAFFGNGVG